MSGIGPRGGLLALAIASVSVTPVSAQATGRMDTIEQQIRALQ